MHFLRPLLSGLLLASTANCLAQTAPAPVVPPTAAPETAPDKLLLKVGLNTGRAFRYSGYYGLAARLPVSVGAEYLLSPKFTLYAQLDADVQLSRRNEYFGDQHFAIPTGAVGIGARYYYNQAGRARHHRPHGPFAGNYLALEAHTELRQRYGTSTEVAPGLNLLWGMQRRLGRSFLFDFNVGAGLGPVASRTGFGIRNPGSNVNITTQINLSVYFGR